MQVMIEGNCKPKSNCITCQKGQNSIVFVNETWAEDPCTNCTCTGKILLKTIISRIITQFSLKTLDLELER